MSFYYGKTRMAWLPEGEKIDMFSCFDTIPACDRRTDGQTSCDSIVRAVGMHRAVKISEVGLYEPLGAVGFHEYHRSLQSLASVADSCFVAFHKSAFLILTILSQGSF